MSATDKEKRSYDLQTGILETMQEEAVKTDRSLSYLVQDVWQANFEQIQAKDLEAEPAGDQTTQSVFVPADMHQQIQSKAKELGCTPGRLIEAAWKLSRK